MIAAAVKASGELGNSPPSRTGRPRKHADDAARYRAYRGRRKKRHETGHETPPRHETGHETAVGLEPPRHETSHETSHETGFVTAHDKATADDQARSEILGAHVLSACDPRNVPRDQIPFQRAMGCACA
jgi:hypothetical protein